MSGLVFLERLLDGAAVEWVPLGEVIQSLKTGLNPRANFQLNTPDADCYYVTVREIQNGKVSFLEKTDKVDAKALALINNRSNLEVGDILFSGTGTVGRIAVIEMPPRNWNIKEGVYSIKPNQDMISPKFLAHLLYSQNIVDDYKKKIVGSPVISLPMAELKRLSIPIPCPENPQKSLAIQAEIVRILDAFTALTAELTAELTARKTQYNHYRNQLLSFEGEEVEWKTLGDVVRIRTGQSINKNMIAENPGEYPVINSGREPLGYFDQWNTDNDPIGITSRGAGVGSITWREGKYFRGNLNYSVTIKEPKSLDVRFLYHILEQFQPEIKQLCTFDGIPALNAGNLVGLNIPVPPFDEQKRIANILDKFDTITTSLTEGLPREIALRQKQSEYYRNLLLSFPKGDEA